MSRKRINYICCFCGKQERRRILLGEPKADGCPNSKDNGLHWWIDDRMVEGQYRMQGKDAEFPMDAEHIFLIGCRYGMWNEKGRQWYQRAAELGYPEAMLKLGEAYAEGRGILRDAGRGVEWYRKAADCGNTEAMLFLGEIYANQEYGLQDKAEAVQWFRKAADKGRKTAMLTLGYAYKHGEGVERNIKEAIKWYRRFDEITTVAPSFMIGGCLAGGIMWDGFITDVMNQTDGSTVYGMAQRGYAYEHGIAGVEQDKKEAVAWYRKAAEADGAYSKFALGGAYSMFALGNAYAKGEGVGKDEEKALEWYCKAARVVVEKARARKTPIDLAGRRAANEMYWKTFRPEITTQSSI